MSADDPARTAEDAATAASPRPSLEDVWPLFGLRIRSERLVLRLPSDDEIAEMIGLAKAGIHPPDEMPFGVAWTRTPSPEFERGFIQYPLGGPRDVAAGRVGAPPRHAPR